ncbi:MAG: Fpg/Nei family DNA glycosylase, partial [Actinomycetota bacterium]|nr:Fpg/Nei family DNA glycosylase [Actinomycetota bacterium]
MPEGHTVRRQAQELRECFDGSVVHVSSPQGRFADGAALLDGSTLEGTDAHGKHLFVEFTGARWVHVHLGLYGTWTYGAGTAAPPRGAIRVRLESDSAWADLRGPTACEVVTPAQKAVIHARLGPDPLRRDGDATRAWARISRSATPIGVLLMDQTVVAGVGNVFRAEVLYRAGIAPHRPGRALRLEEWEALWTDLRRLMRAGVRAGRIVTT